MTLPVSMEDTELFPKERRLEIQQSRNVFSAETFTQMKKGLSQMWWSRLVISVRGYVINYEPEDDEKLFHIDDAFIAIHRFLAEKDADVELAAQFIQDLETIVNFENMSDVLGSLASGKPVRENPFESERTKTSFIRVFGEKNPITYRVANGQKLAYSVFMKILWILEQRWEKSRNGSDKKRGIRFETDPEWQPDERVVLFQQFFTGNRTWVLLDFDRYVLNVWRPNGSRVIFGDRFVDKKLRAGFQLCASCGMVEQQPAQFALHHGVPVCSPECVKLLPPPSA